MAARNAPHRTSPEMSKPIIQIRQLTAAYAQKTVLRDISLTIYDDDYLGIIGPNGGGKTTLMKLILGMMKPLSGTIVYFKQGKRVEQIRMGYLPQYTNIDKHFPIVVNDVVLSGIKQPLFKSYTAQQRQQALQTLQQMELADLQQRPIGQLSGGQMQRVLLARAIVEKPDVLILDEPNTYIDKRFQEQMYQMLADLNRQCAIVMVSHDIAETVHYAKHIACVNETLHYHPTTDIPQDKLKEHFLHI